MNQLSTFQQFLLIVGSIGIAYVLILFIGAFCGFNNLGDE